MSFSIVLYPLLEGASLQEAEDLQEIWVNMLANAAAPAELPCPPVVPGDFERTDLCGREVS